MKADKNKKRQGVGQSGQIARLVRERIENKGESIWRLDDFAEFPSYAVMKALSRLTKRGDIERVSKGVYYRSVATALGKSKPHPSAMVTLATKSKQIFPSGISAANLLGLTSQTSRRPEVATTSASLPKKLIGHNTVVHSRRPDSWNTLTEIDAATLDVLRCRGGVSELSPEKTVDKILGVCAEGARFERLLKVSSHEPPRVRAMLGAIGEQLRKPEKFLDALRQSLNPSSRFDFGQLEGLACSQNWQAKKRK